ncbi:MAG TPA: tetratricopeptide repeat protein [Pyrinomonadaceae bacterium]|nr:tetratricopeptide repeat protein [Pyrinomonadaceae bacterium]
MKFYLRRGPSAAALALLLLAHTAANASARQDAAPSPTPDAQSAQTVQPPAQATRERRAQAYAKLLEGQRIYFSVRSGGRPVDALQQARAAFRQAVELDPRLAEARTALAEIAFFFFSDLPEAEREARAAVATDKDNLGARRVLSRVYSIKSNLSEGPVVRAEADRAVVELREVLRLRPTDAEALALLGEIYLATGREKEAVDAFRGWAAAPPSVEGRFYQILTRGRELAPDVAQARLSEALLRAGRTDEAAAAASRALALEPDNATYLDLLDNVIEAGGSFSTEIVGDLRRMVAANPKNSSAVGLLARAEAKAGRIDEAAATLRAGIAARAPGEREHLTLSAQLAQILADGLRYDEAVAAYEELLRSRGIGEEQVTPDKKNLVSLVLGRVIELRRLAGKPDEALTVVTRMRRLLGSDDPTPDLHNVLLLRQLGRRAEALDAARSARVRHPGEASFARLEATALSDVGRAGEGLELLRAGLKGTPEDFDYYLAISGLLTGAGRGAEAVEAARKALELAPADSKQKTTQALVVLASAQERAGDLKGSEDSLRRILKGDPNNATALNNLGYFLAERGERLEDARAMIQRAVDSEPNNPQFLDSLGWVYFKLGKLEEAERYLSEAARRNPHSVAIHEHLGDVMYSRGRGEEARAAWRKALSLSVEAVESNRIKAKINGEVGK